MGSVSPSMHLCAVSRLLSYTFLSATRRPMLGISLDEDDASPIGQMASRQEYVWYVHCFVRCVSLRINLTTRLINLH